MRSTDAEHAAVVEIGIASRTVRFVEQETQLPDLSFRLLRLLGERAPEPVAFAEIEQSVWGAQASRGTIKQRVKMLRDSLASLGLRGGVGYRLTRSLALYKGPVEVGPWWRSRRIAFAVSGLTAGAGALVLYLVQPTP